MLRNYFKIAFRNLSRNKLFTFINIFGLALSMSVCLLVLMRIKEQLSYDKFHPDASNIYRIITEVTNRQGAEYRLATTPLPLAPALVNEYDLVDKYVRFYPVAVQKANTQGKQLLIDGCFTDSHFLDVFGFRLKAGNAATALAAPNTIVISNETATKFFGSQNPVGQVISLDDLGSFTVTGILEKPAGKSHLEFNAYLSMSSVGALEKAGKLNSISEQWNNTTSAYTYALLKKGAGQKQLEKAVGQISSTLMKNTKTEGRERVSFEVQPFNDIILGEDLAYNLGNTGSLGKVMAEIAISFIILLSACFNYTNLSLARSLKRGKEVGIRKVAGAFRFQIFFQFVVESLFITFLSLALACLFLQLIMDYAPFSSEMVPPGATLNFGLLTWFVVFSLFAGLLAGVLPAWALSSFKPVEVLKNLSNIKLFGSNGLRKGLIVVQFTLSLVIIIFTLVFFKQFNYMAMANPGFDARNILTIPLYSADPQLLRNEIAQLKGVAGVSAVSTNPGKSSSGTVAIKQKPADEPIGMEYYDVDENFISEIGLSLVAGSTFKEHSSATETEVILSETALKTLHFKSAAEAINEVVWLGDSSRVKIAGVIKDFYHRGLETPYRPLVLRNRSAEFNYLNIRAVAAHDKALVASIEGIWKKMNPVQPFEGSWLYDDIYARKSAWGTVSMLGFLAVIAVTLACLGMLGMVVYSTETRKKEIGIRKIMGASVTAIIGLLSKSFLRLVVIAGLIALPVSYVLSYFFLNLFANRITIGFGILSWSFISMLLLSLLIICSQVYKAAIENPVKNLRTE
jgi:putative ABC transport system permease protein